MSAVGIDGCPRGWIAVALRDRVEARAHFLPGIDHLAEAVPDVEVVAIDIPIGLPTVEEPRRPADVEARRQLGPRRSSLFFPPVRRVFDEADHQRANALSRDLTGSGLSRQVWGLRAKILEVEAWLPVAPCPVYEAHPELCFAELLGHPAQFSKKTWAGFAERRQALGAAGIALDGVDADAGQQATPDDLLDAAAAAWTARRILTGAARTVPVDPPHDPVLDRPAAIWV